MSSPTPGRVNIPRLESDLISSLSPWEIEIRLGHLVLVIPALSAKDWLTVLLSPQFDSVDILPGLLEDPSTAEDVISEALLDESITVDDIEKAAWDALTLVAGRPPWVTMRLILQAKESWHVLGADMLRKANADTVSLSAWLDILLHEILARLDEQQLAMFVMKLEIPPPEFADAVEPHEMSASEFLAGSNA